MGGFTNKTYRKNIPPNFITCSDNVGLSIPTQPTMLQELGEDTVPLPEPIKFCLDLLKSKIPLGTHIEFRVNFGPSSLVKNTILHVPFFLFIHHEFYKQLLNQRRPQFHFLIIIQFIRHLIRKIHINIKRNNMWETHIKHTLKSPLLHIANKTLQNHCFTIIPYIIYISTAS